MANEKRMDVVILGLLRHDTMTGYEIKKRIDTALKYFWSGSFGSIYPTLNTLEKDGYVTKAETTENGRAKIIYTITEKGHSRLKEWLSAPVVKDELHYETLLKLFFGGELGVEGTLQHIQNFEDKIRGELPILEMCVAQLEGILEEEEHKYYLLTAKFGVETYRGYLKWCKDAKEILGKE